MELARVSMIGAFLAITCADGTPIIAERFDVDQGNTGVYFRQPTDALDLGALTSTGNGLFSFDTDDINDFLPTRRT